MFAPFCVFAKISMRISALELNAQQVTRGEKKHNENNENVFLLITLCAHRNIEIAEDSDCVAQ